MLLVAVDSDDPRLAIAVDGVGDGLLAALPEFGADGGRCFNDRGEVLDESLAGERVGDDRGCGHFAKWPPTVAVAVGVEVFLRHHDDLANLQFSHLVAPSCHGPGRDDSPLQ
jgi:hypothetical protein